jgi:hypothetical protein
MIEFKESESNDEGFAGVIAVDESATDVGAFMDAIKERYPLVYRWRRYPFMETQIDFETHAVKRRCLARFVVKAPLTEESVEDALIKVHKQVESDGRSLFFKATHRVVYMEEAKARAMEVAARKAALMFPTPGQNYDLALLHAYREELGKITTPPVNENHRTN